MLAPGIGATRRVSHRGARGRVGAAERGWVASLCVGGGRVGGGWRWVGGERLHLAAYECTNATITLAHLPKRRIVDHHRVSVCAEEVRPHQKDFLHHLKREGGETAIESPPPEAGVEVEQK